MMPIFDKIKIPYLNQLNWLKWNVPVACCCNADPPVADAVIQRVKVLIEIFGASESATDVVEVDGFDSAVTSGANHVCWNRLKVEKRMCAAMENVFYFFNRRVPASLVKQSNGLIEQHGMVDVSWAVKTIGSIGIGVIWKHGTLLECKEQLCIIFYE